MVVETLPLAPTGNVLYTQTMSTLSLILPCAILVSAALVSAAGASPDETAVLATLDAMGKATIAKDIPTLTRIYGDDITYAHSSAATQTKA